MKIKLEKIEDRVLLSEYLLSLGHQCGTSEYNLNVDTSEMSATLISRLTDITPAKLKALKWCQEYLADKELEVALKVEDDKIKLERVRDNRLLSQAVRYAASRKLGE